MEYDNQYLETMIKKHIIEIEELKSSSKINKDKNVIYPDRCLHIQEYYIKFNIIRNSYPNRFKLDNLEDLTLQQAHSLYSDCVNDLVSTSSKYDFTYEDIKKSADFLAECMKSEIRPDIKDIFPSQYGIIIDKIVNKILLDKKSESEIRENINKFEDFCTKVCVLLLAYPNLSNDNIKEIKN